MSYGDNYEMILGELQQSLGGVDEEAVKELVDSICNAQQVFVVGVGRVLMMLQAFTKRLNHLGIQANYVGAVDEPAITDKDVLIVGSGSGESILLLGDTVSLMIAEKKNITDIHALWRKHANLE